VLGYEVLRDGVMVAEVEVPSADAPILGGEEAFLRALLSRLTLFTAERERPAG
jgi:hypothetical protein